MGIHTDSRSTPIPRTNTSPSKCMVPPKGNGPAYGSHCRHGHSSGRHNTLIGMVFLPALLVMVYQAVILRPMLWREEEATTAFDGPPPLTPTQQEERQTPLLERRMSTVPETTTEAAPLGLPLRNRTITLVHVGKAGGSSIRAATSLLCRKNTKTFDTPTKLHRCISVKLDPNNVLAHAIQYYCHMDACPASEVHNSTSFLFLLRNPVDRVISNWRYAHPHNCQVMNGTLLTSQKACGNQKHVQKRGHAVHRLFGVCFPSAAMEEFAQNIASPFPSSMGNNTHHPPMAWEQQQQCRWIARQFVQGQWAVSPGPHMKYNYEYYRNVTIVAHPHKEVLGVRTDYEWDDMKALDIAMEGNGVFGREGLVQTHGSESYVPSPLTNQAYQKLCCVLEREIRIYGDLVNQVINLTPQDKQAMMEDVRQKCSVGTRTWDQWSHQCQERLEADRRELEPFRHWENQGSKQMPPN